MKYAARGSGHGPPPLPQPAQRDSGTRLVAPEPPPSTHFSPLPLGSEAFMPPLAPADEAPEVPPRRWQAPAAAGLAVSVFGAVIALTLVLRQTPEPIASEPPSAVRTAPAAARGASAASADAAVVATARAPAPVRVKAAVVAAPPPQAQPAAEPERSAAETRRARPRRSSRSKEPALDKPSRAQVIAAMARVQRQVKGCLPGARGSLTADVTVLGKTGRVTTAQINGQKGEVGSCIARAVRKAKFPKFTTESLNIRYPMAF